MRLFLHPVSLLSPYKHRISISNLKIFEKYLRVFAASINKHRRLRTLKPAVQKPEGHGFYERMGRMESTAKQYETAVSNAADISQVLLDMEGGKYVLALFNELVQELLDAGNIPGATLVVRKLYEAAEVPIEQDTLSENNNAAWIMLFAIALGDALEESIF